VLFVFKLTLFQPSQVLLLLVVQLSSLPPQLFYFQLLLKPSRRCALSCDGACGDACAYDFYFFH